MADKERPRPAGVSPAPRAAAVFNPLPAGSRDLLPVASRRRRTITRELLECFERWGYDPVSTPAIEYFEVFRRGLDDRERERCVRFIEAGSGELVTLRSDITPQIARIAARQLGDAGPAERSVRLSYAADVVRLPDRGHERSEFHQAGVELVGQGDVAADVESISLTHAALEAVGLRAFGIDLAHTAIVRDAFERARLEPTEARLARACLGRKDRAGLAQSLGRAKVGGALRDALVALCDLHGPPQVLRRARTSLRALRIQPLLDRLEELLQLLASDDPRAHARISVDLGEVRGFNYYTGVRLRVWAPGVSEPIVRGGRYDDLIGRYGVDVPATGFAIDLDALEGALLHAGVDIDGGPGRPARLVAVAAGADVATRLAAMAEARAARAGGLRSWVQIGLELAEARRAAEQVGAQRLTFFSRRSGPQRWSREAGGWRKQQPRKKSR